MHKLGNERNYWSVSKTQVDLRRKSKEPISVTIAAEPQIVTFDLQKTAIIVIDMQNDFCTAKGWLHHIGVDVSVLHPIVDRLNSALPILRQAGVPVIWVNWGNREDRLNINPSILHVYNMDGEGVGIGEPLPANQSRVLEKGSWGASIMSELNVDETDIHVDKYRMSGFWDSPLDSILRNLKIDTILFAGVNIDQCVMATLQDAVNAGFDSILLEDLCATTSPSFCIDAALYNVKQCYGFVAASSALIDALSQRVESDEFK